jgi:hypothetical protein
MRNFVTAFLVVFSCFYAGVAGVKAQAPGQMRVINSIKAVETPEGVLISIFETPLLSHVTRENGDRFFIIIPRAGASIVESNVYSGGLVIVRTERQDKDAVITFDLFPGSRISVKRNSDRLEVLVTPSRLLNSNNNKADLPEKPNSEKVIQTGNNRDSTRSQNTKADRPAIETNKPVNESSEVSRENAGALIDSVKVTQSSLRIRRVSRRPTLEEFINRTANGSGTAVTDFRQLSPNDGNPVSQPTKAYLSYDDSNLYVVFVCREAPGKVRAHMAKREDIFNDDMVSVTLDTFRDQRRAYVFSANPLGVQLDSITTEGQGSDDSFDTLWYSEGKLTDDGFAVLMTIPFKSLRFSSASVQSWGIALGRIIAHNNESAYFPHITQRKQGFVQQAATLEGLEQISAGRNIQIIPYYVASNERFIDFLPDSSPYFRRQKNVRAGLDAKVVIKNAVTLDLTVNPDFSQVESDEPQVTVNRRFETFFPEKRPFFIENAGFFQTPENLFFSRRIVDPQFGARLTGKIGKWAVGGLLIDDKAAGTFFLPNDPEYKRRAFIGVARLQREFAEQSSIGMMYTDYRFAGSYERVFSVDTRLRLNRNWSFTGQAVRSFTKESNGESVEGSAYLANFSRSGRKFNYDFTYTDRSPDFRAILGFIPRSDVRQIDQNATYRWRPNKKGIVSFGPSGFVALNWDRTGRLQDWYANGGFIVEFTNLTGVEINRSQSYEYFAGQGFNTENTRFSFYSDWLKWLGIYGSYNSGTNINYSPPNRLNPFVANSNGGTFEVSFRPSTQISFQQSYIYSHLNASRSSGYSVNTEPENVYYNHIFRSKLNYQVNRELSLRTIIDYNALLPNQTLIGLDRSKQLTADILLTYLLNPGTAFYIGYSNSYENLVIIAGSPAALQRTASPFNSSGGRFFVKMNNLIRF